MPYTYRLFADVVRHSETQPIATQSRFYPSINQTREIAERMLMPITAMYGPGAGYALYRADNSNKGPYVVVDIGPDNTAGHRRRSANGSRSREQNSK